MLFVATVVLSLVMVCLKGFDGPWYIYLFRFVLLFSYLIPISLRVNLDMGKIYYSLMVSALRIHLDLLNKKVIKVRTFFTWLIPRHELKTPVQFQTIYFRCSVTSRFLEQWRGQPPFRKSWGGSSTFSLTRQAPSHRY